MADDETTAVSTEVHHGALAPTTGGGFFAAPRTFEDLKEMAKYMAKGELMVGHAVRGNPGDCMAVIMQAGRFSMDPFALSQKTYVVEDKGGNRKIAYEAQAVASMIAASGALEGRLRYVYDGEGQNRRVTVRGRIRGDSEDCEITTPMLKDIGVKNSPLWKSDPDQQLAYYGARSWCRRHAPDVLMGVYVPDEMDSVSFVNVTPTDDPAARLTSRLSQPAAPPDDEPEVIDAAEVVEESGDGPATTLPAEPEPPADASAPVEDSAPATPGDLPFDEPEPAKPAPKATPRQWPTLVAFTELSDKAAVEKAAKAYTDNWIAARRSIQKGDDAALNDLIDHSRHDCMRVRDVSVELYQMIVEAM